MNESELLRRTSLAIGQRLLGQDIENDQEDNDVRVILATMLTDFMNLNQRASEQAVEGTCKKSLQVDQANPGLIELEDAFLDCYWMLCKMDKPKQKYDELAALIQNARCEVEPENSPIGTCPSCGTPVYTVEGFCGVCGK